MASERSQANLFDRLLASTLPIVPRPIVRKVAMRYVAGKTVAEAVDRCREVEAWGACTTLDVLGEEIESIAESEYAEAAYLEVLDAIEAEKLDANISIKLTAFGLKLDEKICHERVERVVAKAKSLKNFVRIDMEDSSTTSATIATYRQLRVKGFDNCGMVLQAYMRRTLQDVQDNVDYSPSYRICKGIYVEPEEIAIKNGAGINDNYMAALESMIDSNSYVGIATHDHELIERSRALIKKKQLSLDQYEFQMLLGVDEKMARTLVEEGHKVRIYVPFGDQWYAYCIRRLKENPKIGRYILKGMFQRR